VIVRALAPLCMLLLPGLVASSAAWADAAGLPPATGSLAAVAEKLDRPFPDPLPAKLTVAGGRLERVLLGNCHDYLAVKARIVDSDSDRDLRVLRYQVVDCDALALIGRAANVRSSALPRDFLTVTDTRRYPASLAPNVSDDERARAARPGSTLQTMTAVRRFTATRPDTLELKGRAYGIRLSLLARGDFNGDGWEDAAFRWEAHARRGTYADSRLVVLTRLDSRPLTAFIEVEPAAPDLPK